MCVCVCMCVCGFIPCVPKLTNGTQGHHQARVWADPVKGKYSGGGYEVARGHEEEEVDLLPKNEK